MKYIYEVNELNAIKIWDTGNPNEMGAPFFFQPDWPDCTPWANRDEAVTWAELFIESLENPESKFVPGDSPKEPKRLRPEITGEDNASN